MTSLIAVLPEMELGFLGRLFVTETISGERETFIFLHVPDWLLNVGKLLGRRVKVPGRQPVDKNSDFP